jgi:hypothetical protein
MNLTLEHWTRLSGEQRLTAARQLQMQLPSGFAFDSIRNCRLGPSAHDVALFRLEGAMFAFIPGGSVSIGWDADREWLPLPTELASWRRTANEYGLDKTIHEHIRDATLRRREVELTPMLVETVAAEVGWEPVSPDDPSVQEILREDGWRSVQVEVDSGAVTTRVRKPDAEPGSLRQAYSDGNIVAERSLRLTHSEAAEGLRSKGFRFPTPDEWEYACGSGAPTLFRWGDHAPCDRYPTDISPTEAQWRRQWALSLGRLPRAPEGFVADWNQHRCPNAFGLLIASDPYKLELTAEAGITRGGDGGSMICGGSGFFIGWLSLATAYFEEHACRHDPLEPVMPGHSIGRRVLDLA